MSSFMFRKLYLSTHWQQRKLLRNACLKACLESGHPNTNVALPDGWTLKKVFIEKPLVVSPFGTGNDCFYNILGDNLGQGYHQYIFANEFYPKWSETYFKIIKNDYILK